MFNKRFMLIVLCTMSLSFPFHAVAKEWHVVSTSKIPGDGTDVAPFTTLVMARDAIRNHRTSLQTDDPTTVWLHGGTYVLRETFLLNRQDSGTENAKVIWKAVPGETVSIVGDGVEALVAVYDASHITLSGWNFRQASEQAIEVAHGDAINIHNVTVQRIGHTGIHLFGGRNCTVTGCVVEDCSSIGIRVEAGSRESLTSCNHLIENNTVTRCGDSVTPFAAAMHIVGVGCKVQNNSISDCDSCGIRIDGNNHAVYENQMVRVCLKNRDTGAIYLGQDWTERGNVIESNRIAHVGSEKQRDVIAIYLDDFASGNIIRNNNLSDAGLAIAIGGGEANQIESNVIKDCLVGIQLDNRGQTWLSSAVKSGGFARLAIDRLKPFWDVYLEHYPELNDAEQLTHLQSRDNVLRNNVFQRCTAIVMDSKKTERMNSVIATQAGVDRLVDK
ncbi:right-handed parallel beta-helix repeat-containing protein [Novipirellula herctigrandis]